MVLLMRTLLLLLAIARASPATGRIIPLIVGGEKARTGDWASYVVLMTGAKFQSCGTYASRLPTCLTDRRAYMFADKYT